MNTKDINVTSTTANTRTNKWTSITLHYTATTQTHGSATRSTSMEMQMWFDAQGVPCLVEWRDADATNVSGFVAQIGLTFDKTNIHDHLLLHSEKDFAHANLYILSDYDGISNSLPTVLLDWLRRLGFVVGLEDYAEGTRLVDIKSPAELGWWYQYSKEGYTLRNATSPECRQCGASFIPKSDAQTMCSFACSERSRVPDADWQEMVKASNPFADAEPMSRPEDLEPQTSPTMRQIEALEDAITILQKAKQETYKGSDTVFGKVIRIASSLDKQIAELVASLVEPTEAPTPDALHPFPQPEPLGDDHPVTFGMADTDIVEVDYKDVQVLIDRQDYGADKVFQIRVWRKPFVSDEPMAVLNVEFALCTECNERPSTDDYGMCDECQEARLPITESDGIKIGDLVTDNEGYYGRVTMFINDGRTAIVVNENNDNAQDEVSVADISRVDDLDRNWMVIDSVDNEVLGKGRTKREADQLAKDMGEVVGCFPTVTYDARQGEPKDDETTPDVKVVLKPREITEDEYFAKDRGEEIAQGTFSEHTLKWLQGFAKDAMPINDDEAGSERQVDAENKWLNVYCNALGLDAEEEVDDVLQGGNPTTEEIITYQMTKVRRKFNEVNYPKAMFVREGHSDVEVPEWLIAMVDSKIAEDDSWHNDMSPNFSFKGIKNAEGDTLILWVGLYEEEDISNPFKNQFTFYWTDADGAFDDDSKAFETQDSDKAKTFVMDALEEQNAMTSYTKTKLIVATLNQVSDFAWTHEYQDMIVAGKMINGVHHDFTFGQANETFGASVYGTQGEDLGSLDTGLIFDEVTVDALVIAILKGVNDYILKSQQGVK